MGIFDCSLCYAVVMNAFERRISLRKGHVEILRSSEISGFHKPGLRLDVWFCSTDELLEQQQLDCNTNSVLQVFLCLDAQLALVLFKLVDIQANGCSSAAGA